VSITAPAFQKRDVLVAQSTQLTHQRVDLRVGGLDLVFAEPGAASGGPDCLANLYRSTGLRASAAGLDKAHHSREAPHR